MAATKSAAAKKMKTRNEVLSKPFNYLLRALQCVGCGTCSRVTNLSASPLRRRTQPHLTINLPISNLHFALRNTYYSDSLLRIIGYRIAPSSSSTPFQLPARPPDPT